MLHEIPPTDSVDTFMQRRTLHALITDCRDASMTFRAASLLPSAHRAELMVIARRRSSFARRLSQFLRDPEDANVTGSMRDRANRWMLKTRATLLGQSHLGDSLAACLRADARTHRSYARALDMVWNGDIAEVLDKQRLEVEVSSTRVRTLRGHL